MTLYDIEVGKKVIITKVEGKGAFHRRLLDMGLTKGQEIVIKKVAPLGDPIDIQVRGYELSIRNSEAKFIRVKGS